MNIINILNVYLFKVFRPIYNKSLRKKLKNSDFTLLCNNCCGGIICHDLGVKFNTPFINVGVHYKDFIKVCCNLEKYMASELMETREEGIAHPMGLLGDVKLYFPHDASFEDAKKNWDKRASRINYDNIYVLMGQHLDGDYDSQCLVEFNKIPYKKCVMLPFDYDGVEDGFVIRRHESINGGDMNLLHVTSPIHRVLDQFEFVDWLNL